MYYKLMTLSLIITCCTFLQSGCATIVNDPNIPIDFVFEDGSEGECTFKNKRGEWSCDMPCKGVLIRRSDDNLVYNCSTVDGKKLQGAVKSRVEGGKMAASVIFWDLGITDAITDKHRRYQSNVIIPVKEGQNILISEDPAENGTDQNAESSAEE